MHTITEVFLSSFLVTAMFVFICLGIFLLKEVNKP
jgi:hypothetical protein